jgi:uncharacterized membrane protein
MTLKNYKIFRLIIIVILSASISVSITLKNYYLPIIFVVSAWAAMSYCRKQLKTTDVLADERDYQIAGQSARYTIAIYGWIGAFGTFILLALSKNNPYFYDLSQYLAYSVCFIMLLNSFLFKYFSKRK